MKEIIIKKYAKEARCCILENKEDQEMKQRIIIEKGGYLKLVVINQIKEKDLASHLIIEQQQDSTLQLITIYLGEGNYEQTTEIFLEGDGTKCEVKSGYLIHQSSTYKMNYGITHNGKRSQSDLVVKGALLDHSKKYFKGDLYFNKGSKGAKGSETEDTRLLSPQALSYTLPAMWCEEEAVEGNHGSTSGKLLEEKLFYLLSRGLSEAEAKMLMVEAQLQPIIREIGNEEIEAQVQKRLAERSGLW